MQKQLCGVIATTELIPIWGAIFVLAETRAALFLLAETRAALFLLTEKVLIHNWSFIIKCFSPKTVAIHKQSYFHYLNELDYQRI